MNLTTDIKSKFSSNFISYMEFVLLNIGFLNLFKAAFFVFFVSALLLIAKNEFAFNFETLAPSMMACLLMLTYTILKLLFCLQLCWRNRIIVDLMKMEISINDNVYKISKIEPIRKVVFIKFNKHFWTVAYIPLN